MTTPPAPAPAKIGTKSIGAWARSHHAEVYMGAAALVVTVALYMKSRSKSTGTSATTTQSTPSSITYLPTTSGAAETGSPSGWSTTGEQPARWGTSSTWKGKINPGGTLQTPTTTTSAAQTTQASAAPQYATTALGGADYYILGGFQATGRYSGENVSTNEPVFFTWTGSGAPTQGAPPAGAAGVVAYTPTSTPVADIGNPSDNVPTWAQGYT